ncbi:MAG: LysM peptidoglycan-binding domain-containing protein [Firmicutes bacterium]|nr:LysM peptidoglycan-binding domain-containing protein [Bacillota bacterium]
MNRAAGVLRRMVYTLLATAVFVVVAGIAPWSAVVSDLNPVCIAAHFGYRPLRRGAAGEDVWYLQSLLRRLGLFTVKPTGYFGRVTECSVRRFQSSNGMRPDGVVGGDTMRIARALVAAWEWSQSGYEVKDGDTLESISQAWGIPAAVLAKLNGLPADVTLKPGDRIKIPVPEFIMHEVEKGECLAGISSKHGLDWRQVAAWNGIRHPYVIRPGDMLVIPVPPEREER